jgi:hypothetical protein
MVLDELTPDAALSRLESFTSYAETMYLETGNPLYALRVWQAYRKRGCVPPEWVLHHMDDTAAAAWQLLDKGAEPRGDEVAAAFGFGPWSKRYTAASNPRDFLIGHMIMRYLHVRHDGKTEAAVAEAAKVWNVSRAEIYRALNTYRKLPGTG